MIFTVFVFDTYTKTICIRICCKNEICIYFFCKLQSKFKSFCCFRIRIADCREISVRKFLLFNHIYILESEFFKDSSCRDVSGSVKRCINDFEVLALFLDCIHMDNLFLKFCHISIVYLFTDHLEETSFFCFCLVHGLNCIPVGDGLNLSHDTAVMWRCDLCTVFPVYFVSVVFRRVVAGSYVDTCHAAQMTYCKGKFRCRS